MPGGCKHLPLPFRSLQQMSEQLRALRPSGRQGNVIVSTQAANTDFTAQPHRAHYHPT